MPSILLKTFKVVILIIILVLFGRIGYVLLTNSYPDVLAMVLDKMYKGGAFDLVLNEPAYLYTYKVLKILIPLLTVYIFFRLLRYALTNKPVFFSGEDKPFYWLKASMHENKYWFKQLDRPVKFSLIWLLAIQALTFICLIFIIPYHYDEAWTYTNFCGNSIISTLTYYPAPNNHILFNLIANYTLYLPIDEIIAIRLPSYIASLFATWYFFKLVAKLFSNSISLLCTLLFTFSYCIIIYSIQARGYALLVFFSLMCIYAFANIVAGRQVNKYLVVYSLATIGGFVTIPSFLYFYLPASLVLFFILLINKRFQHVRGLVLSGISSAIITLLFYLPIILLMGGDTLTENNGVIKRSYDYIVANMYEHFTQSWAFLTGIENLNLFWLSLLFAGPIFFLFGKNTLKRYIALLCIVLLLSPLPILLIHQVIPFARTWIFLSIPLYISIGYLLSLIAPLLKSIKLKHPLQTGVYTAVVITYGILATLRLVNEHRESNAIDYVSREYVQLIKPYYGNIQLIRFNPDNMGFYLAENIQFEIFRQTGKKITLYYLDKIDPPNSELIVLPVSDVKTQIPLTYQPIGFSNNFFKVYFRNDL